MSSSKTNSVCCLLVVSLWVEGVYVAQLGLLLESITTNDLDHTTLREDRVRVGGGIAFLISTSQSDSLP